MFAARKELPALGRLIVNMRNPRFLLAFSSILLLVGGIAHAAAFNRALAVIAASNLPPFIGNSFKALWLADSATQVILAVLFGLVAARPSTATRSMVALPALIPATTAVLIYTFLGGFYAGHLLLVAAAAAFFAGLQFPGARVQGSG